MTALAHPNFELYSRWRDLTPIQRHICIATLGSGRICPRCRRRSLWRRLFG